MAFLEYINFNKIWKIPLAVGPRKLTLHKSFSMKNKIVYLVLVECFNFKDHIWEAVNLSPVLRVEDW